MATRKRRRRNPIVRRPARRRRRHNPARRSNPSGIMGIVMSGLWVGAGMWAGGLIGGFIPRLGSGIVGDAIHGLLTAYGVAWVGSRFTRNAGLMAAGAFAGTAMNLLSGVLGGAGSLVSSVTGSIGAGAGSSARQPQAPSTGAQPAPGANVVSMPSQMVA